MLRLLLAVVLVVGRCDEASAGALARARARAWRYDSPTCQRAIAASWRRFPWAAMAKDSFQAQEVMRRRSPMGLHWLYVRVQKSGSRLISSSLASRDTRKNAKFERRDFCVPGPCAVRTEAFAWSVVRDPWARGLSAYAEVVDRGGCFAKHFPEAFAARCEAASNATERYARYLEAMTSGALACGQAFHAWPQALLMDVVAAPGKRSSAPRYSAVGRLEALREDLPAILAAILGRRAPARARRPLRAPSSTVARATRRRRPPPARAGSC